MKNIRPSLLAVFLLVALSYPITATAGPPDAAQVVAVDAARLEAVTAEVPETVVTAAPEAEAPAADDAVDPWWKTLLVGVLPHVFEIAGGLLSLLALWLARKFGLKLDREQMDGIVDNAVGWGEQYVRGKVKAKNKPDPKDVKTKVVQMALKQAKQHGVSRRARAELEDLVEARLGLKNVEKDTLGGK